MARPNPSLARPGATRTRMDADGFFVLERYSRRGKQRRPEWHTQAIIKDNRVHLLGRTAMGSYRAWVERGWPSDHNLVMESLFRLKRDTAEFRRNSKKVDHKAHSAKALWLMDHKDFDAPECLLPPGMRPHSKTVVRYNYQTMPAARAMLIMTQGLSDLPFATHVCGNGHLSCVNPKHLEWGNPKSNGRDASMHNGADTEVPADLAAKIIADGQLCAVTALSFDIPAAAVNRIRQMAITIREHAQSGRP